MSQTATRLGAAAIATIFVFGALVCSVCEVEAGPKMVPVKDMRYSVEASLADNLKWLVGKKVVLTLGSGKSVSGTVKSVGDHLIHLEKLEGKEFYDALIRIKDVSAAEARFREYQR